MKIMFVSAWEIIWSNNKRPSKRCMPTHSCSKLVLSSTEVNDVIFELDEQFPLQRLGERIHDHFFSGTALEF